ncbi:MAG: hypothetical protein Q7Q71_01870 [Verrucomicrobiota bacterium JB023]|nr:hypothetical protein [Verrucomicrobiota bacterium JB023]
MPRPILPKLLGAAVIFLAGAGVGLGIFFILKPSRNEVNYINDKKSSVTSKSLSVNSSQESDSSLIEDINLDASEVDSIEMELVSLLRERGGQGALDFYLSLPSGERRMRGVTGALLKISRDEGIERAIQLVMTLSESDIHGMTIPNFFIPVDERDMLRVLSGLRLVKNESLRNQCLQMIFERSSEFDLDEVIVLISNSQLEDEAAGFLEMFVATRMAVERPFEAAEITKLLSQEQKSTLAPDLMRNWPSDLLPEASKWLFENNLTSHALNSSLLALIEANHSENAEAVESLLEELPPGNASDNAHAYFCELLFNFSVSDASKWVLGLKSSDGKDIAARAFLSKMVTESSGDAIDFALNSVNSDSEKLKYMSMVAASLGEKGEGDVISSLRENERIPEELKDVAISSAYRSWALSDPSSLVGDEENSALALEDDKVLANVILSLGSRSPKDAVLWVTESDYGSPEAVGLAYERWARREPTLAAEWVVNVPEGVARDSAYSAIAKSVQFSDPDSAREWCEAIADDEIRIETVREIFGAD